MFESQFIVESISLAPNSSPNGSNEAVFLFPQTPVQKNTHVKKGKDLG